MCQLLMYDTEPTPGKLNRRANEATQAFGFGRVKSADGSYVDIGAATGGATRTIRDNWVSESETEDVPIQEEVVQPDWGT